MERRDFLKLTLGFVAAAGAITGAAVTTAQAAAPPPADDKLPKDQLKPEETAAQRDQSAEPNELEARDGDDLDVSARRWWRRRRRWRRRWWRRRRRIWFRRRRRFWRRRRRWWRRRRVIYY